MVEELIMVQLLQVNLEEQETHLLQIQHKVPMEEVELVVAEQVVVAVVLRVQELMQEDQVIL